MIAVVANLTWLLQSRGDAVTFRRGLAAPVAAQMAALQRILAANADCEFGRKHSFAKMQSVDDYRRRVRPADYDTFAPAIGRMAAGEQGILTAAPVKLFEPSSGSTAASKLIPYTAALQREFQTGLAAWITNVYTQRPVLLGGPAYWSVSPLTQGPQTTRGGTPIGFEDDSAYLGTMGKMVAAALAVPAAVKQIADVDAFRYATLRHLLAAPGLRLISVWNPTFLTLLLDALVAWWPRLVEDVAKGTLTLPAAVAADLKARLSAGLRPAPGRARRLERIDPAAPDAWRAIWPRLGLVSCWADGPAARYARELAQRLAGVPIQPKGLLATEAMVSVPWFGAPGPVLAVTAHFLEFEDDAGKVWLAHELATGRSYTVLVTTSGGLYRYRLHDRVEVVGRAAATPCVRFVGKADRVSDWFGEKLSEGHVARAVETLLHEAGVAARFVLVAPSESAVGVAYTLYLEPAAGRPDTDALAARLDTLLRENFHYDLCRKLGQLQPTRVVAVEDGAARYLAAHQARGMRLGDIKPALLDREPGWDAIFAPTQSVAA
jgi:hypothetical protein